MKLIQVINGEITQHSLPKTGTLKKWLNSKWLSFTR